MSLRYVQKRGYIFKRENRKYVGILRDQIAVALSGRFGIQILIPVVNSGEDSLRTDHYHILKHRIGFKPFSEHSG